MIQPPPRPTAYADRELDCQMALEDEFQALAERGAAAGWSDGETAHALVGLALAHLKARISIGELGPALRLVQESVGEAG